MCSPKNPCHTTRGTHAALGERSRVIRPWSAPSPGLASLRLQHHRGTSCPSWLPCPCLHKEDATLGFPQGPAHPDALEVETGWTLSPQPQASLTGNGQLHPQPTMRPAPRLLESFKMLAGQHDGQTAVVPTGCPPPQPPVSAPGLCPRKPLLTHLGLDGLSDKNASPLPWDPVRLEAHISQTLILEHSCAGMEEVGALAWRGGGSLKRRTTPSGCTNAKGTQGPVSPPSHSISSPLTSHYTPFWPELSRVHFMSDH